MISRQRLFWAAERDILGGSCFENGMIGLHAKREMFVQKVIVN
jgi:hypothetical protein